MEEPVIRGPILVCAGCFKPTSMWKPICNECLIATGVRPNDCILCLSGKFELRDGLHYHTGGGYAGKCIAPEPQDPYRE